MRILRGRTLTVILMLLSTTVTSWPVFVFASVTIGYFFADAELINNFHHQPKRLLLANFIEGFLLTLPFSFGFALCSLLLLIKTSKKMKKVFVSGLILAGIVIVLPLFYLPMSLQNALVMLLLMCWLFLTYLISGFILNGYRDA